MTLYDTQDTPHYGDLDPKDWDAFEQTAQIALSDAIRKLRNAAVGPVWQAPPPDLLSQNGDGLPHDGIGPEAVRLELAKISPYGVGNTHPRFFGWVHGAGSPGNLLAELTAASMNANCGGRNHAAIQIERQLIDWFASLFGFPKTTSGLVLSGTSTATLVAVKAARDAACQGTSRQHGMAGTNLVGYVSAQAHSCLDRAFDMLGLGTDALRKIPVDAAYRMDLKALATQVEADRCDGLTPFFVGGTVGTVNTGAIDTLTQLSEFAAHEKLWFHIDGAFGASLMLSAPDRARLKGIEAADSLAFDFHKWMHVNYEAGCVLIRSESAHRAAFANRPDYLTGGGDGLFGGEPWPVDFGPELSRSFRALKVWAHFLEHGSDKIGRSIRKNCEQAAYLAGQVDTHPDLELLAPATLNICCFRYRILGRSELQMDAMNKRITVLLQERGIAAPSTTRLNGRLAIRVNITNHRTRFEDLDLLIAAIEDIGESLSKSTDFH